MSPNPTILVVDDEKEIRDLIEVYLRNEGFTVLQACNGPEALSLFKERQVDLIVLDIMMPGLDGVQTCLQIRRTSQVPLIMLSAKTQDADKIYGLTAGADDYLAKPFNPLELVARIKSQLRRYLHFATTAAPRQGEIEVGDLVINTATHTVTAGGTEVNLTPTEFAILELLARNRGLVLSVERIYEEVWKDPFFDSANTVMVHIRKIREKLKEHPRQPRYIKTVWGVGYRIEN